MNEIEFKYKKLRLAQDLNKQTLNQVGLKLLKKGEDGLYTIPEYMEIAAYINQLALDNMIKHYILKGEHGDIYLFDSKDIIQACDQLVIEEVEPPKFIVVQCYGNNVAAKDDVPIEISRIKNLQAINGKLYSSGSCVYFLCLESEIVYVGQTGDLSGRLKSHEKEKEYDRVYYMRVPANQLNQVESALIAHLKPRYNNTDLLSNNVKSDVAVKILNI